MHKQIYFLQEFNKELGYQKNLAPITLKNNDTYYKSSRERNEDNFYELDDSNWGAITEKNERETRILALGMCTNQNFNDKIGGGAIRFLKVVYEEKMKGKLKKERYGYEKGLVPPDAKFLAGPQASQDGLTCQFLKLDNKDYITSIDIGWSCLDRPEGAAADYCLQKQNQNISSIVFKTKKNKILTGGIAVTTENAPKPVRTEKFNDSDRKFMGFKVKIEVKKIDDVEHHLIRDIGFVVRIPIENKLQPRKRVLSLKKTNVDEQYLLQDDQYALQFEIFKGWLRKWQNSLTSQIFDFENEVNLTSDLEESCNYGAALGREGGLWLELGDEIVDVLRSRNRSRYFDKASDGNWAQRAGCKKEEHLEFLSPNFHNVYNRFYKNVYEENSN